MDGISGGRKYYWVQVQDCLSLVLFWSIDVKILVTGGTGFLGRHLVWRLAAEGHQVAFTGRNENAAQEVMIRCAHPVQWVAVEHGQANALEILLKASKGIDAIVHCAALSAPWGQSGAFYQANIASTEEVLAVARFAKIKRLVHISTSSVYFEFCDRYHIREDHPLPKPANEYARTKAVAEKLVMDNDVCERVILRPRAIFGPWDNTLLPRLLRVMNKGSLPLMRDGEMLIDLTYVDNVVEAIYLALTRSLMRTLSVYNVTNGEPQSLSKLLTQLAIHFQLHLPLKMRSTSWSLVKSMAYCLETLARFSKKEPLMTRYSAGVLAFGQTLDISAIRNELNYEPVVPIAEGLRRHAQWYRQQQEQGG
jgi:nucleoside-diphosphate-sugar epimerase